MSFKYYNLDYHSIIPFISTRIITIEAASSLHQSAVVPACFSERGREGRLIRLLADTKSRARGTSSGFGVDENTVLVVNDVDGRNPIAEVNNIAGLIT